MANIFSTIRNSFLSIFDRPGRTEPNKMNQAAGKGGMSAAIIQQAKYYYVADINKWKRAIENARAQYMPRRENLMQVYENCYRDLHLQSEVQARYDRVKGRKAKVISDKDGNENVELTKLFKKEWFRDFLDEALKVIFWGPALVEMGAIREGEVSYTWAIPREHFSPQEGIFLTNPYDTTGHSYLIEDFQDIAIEIGKPEKLGLLESMCRAEIMKRSMERAWAEFGEKFGQPTRVAYSSSRNTEDLDKIESFMEDMGASNWALLPEGTRMEWLEAKGTDAYNVFLEFINYQDAKISKMALGTSGLTNDTKTGSFAKTKVQDELADDILKSDCEYLENLVNEKLFPLLIRLGYKLEGYEWRYEDSIDIPLETQWTIDSGLLDRGYIIDEKYLSKKYGVPILGKKEPPQLPPPEQNANPNIKGNPNPNQNFLPFPTNGTVSGTPLHNSMNIAANVPMMIDDPLLPQFEAMVKKLFDGKIKKDDLYEDFIAQLAGIYEQAITQGYEINTDYKEEDKVMLAALKENTFVFSGAKTYEQLKQLNELLKDENGKLREWEDFKKQAAQVHNTYNKTYMKTEYKYAVSSSQMASKYVLAIAEEDEFPLCQFDAVQDNRTRPEHAALDGIILPVREFFKLYHFPLDWGCRCTFRRLRRGEITQNPPAIEYKPFFNNNVGETGVMFSEEHPFIKEIPENKWTQMKADLIKMYHERNTES
jgi:hypothetical protein